MSISPPTHRPSEAALDDRPVQRVEVDSVTGTRLVALVVVSILVSLLTALLVTGALDDEPAAATDQPADTGPPPAADPVTALASGTDVIPDVVPRSDLALAPEDEVNIATAPDMPPAATRTAPAIVEVELEVVENIQTIDPTTGTRYETWGFRAAGLDDGVVVGTPGPAIRARVGDVLRLTVTNPAGNTHPHNIDLHAVTGQGGGAEDTTVPPGESATIEARLLYPGFFMYHCAYGDVPSHISHGMHGGILVDPAEPLPGVDHEWYMVQSEYYTTGAEDGLVTEDRAAITAEEPTHVVYNGAVGALAGDNALQMQVGERARIHFVNAGLNLTANFHPIGSHWDAVYPEAALLNPPLRGSQTTLVPAGGGTVVELVGQVPQTVVLVDHALARTFDKGALGQIVISGDDNPEMFDAAPGEAADAPPEPETNAVADGTPVSILPGSFEAQGMDADDEFAESESPADYSVNVLEVQVGDTVTWTNDDEMMHSVTAVDGQFDSGLFDSGETFSYTFTEPGEYEYYCLPHPWMRAKVIVDE